jgi:glycosyltransferase involved in cell wall biosynthesis
MEFKDINQRIAVIIPCYNEEITIEEVVREFKSELPDAEVYVCDNNSSDHTAAKANEAGATVFWEGRQGKGYAIRNLFRHVDADVYVLVDGDGTYPSAAVRELINPILLDEADMVVGSRLHEKSKSKFHFVNRIGNRFFLWIINPLFGMRVTDVLSGYRAFCRKFVKEIPLFGGGFEIETELTIKALERGYRVIEVPVDLAKRPEGSHSKIRIIRDGIIILNTILSLSRDYKPLTVFGSCGLFLALMGVVLGVIAFRDPDASHSVLVGLLSLGLFLVGSLIGTAGLILHTIVRRFQEFDYQFRLIASEFDSHPEDRSESAADSRPPTARRS